MRLDEHRFVFVTGKGGVGKSTVSAALAKVLAGRGRRVLVAMAHAQERLSTLFGTPPIGPDIARVADGIWAVNIDPERAMAEYGVMIIKLRTVYRAVFDNRYVRTFFRAVPGLHEWAMLGKAWYHAVEEEEGGRPRFDVVVFDAPATGHGLGMLRVPKVILDVAPPGILRRDAERAWTMFADPRKTKVVTVTLPEELPAQETIELVRTIEGELGLTVGDLVVNAMLPPLFSPEERAALRAARGLSSRSAGDRALAAAARRATREDVQSRSLALLAAELPHPKTYLPFVFGDPASPDAVADLAHRLGT